MFNRPTRPGSWTPPASLPDLSLHTHVGLDTESTGKHEFKDLPVGIGIALRNGFKTYLPFDHRGGGNLDKGLVRRWAERELRGKHLINLNIGFDVSMLKNWGVDVEKQGCVLHEVAFPPALLNEHRRSGFNADALGKEYVGRGKAPTKVDPDKIYLAHSADVGEYASEDPLLALDTWIACMPLIQAEGLETVLQLEDGLLYCVNEMERNGARIDVPKLRRWCAETLAEVQRLTLELYSRTKLRVNPDSPQDMERLFNYLKIPYGTTALGHGSFTGDFLKKIQDPCVQMALRIRRLQSIRSKYLVKYLKAVEPDGTLRFTLHQLRGDEYGTITGRFSSAAPSTGGFNAQQVMKVEKQVENFGDEYIIRELFIPDDGFEWFSADAAQIEFRLFAHYANSRKLNEAYAKDPHVDFHDIVKDMLRRSIPTCPRKLAKVGNFGKLYGMGLEAAMFQLGMNEQDAQAFLDTYDEEFPEARRLMWQASQIAQRRGYVKTYLGRRGRFPEQTGYHRALNKVIQGTAADVNKKKLRELYDRRGDLGIHKLRLTVHDEADGDKIKEARYTKAIQETLDEQAFPFRVPILWDLGTGANWKECA